MDVPGQRLALYLFVPLPLAIVSAVLARSRTTIAACLVVLGILLVSFGPLFLPKHIAPGRGPALTVETFNMLQSNEYPAGVVAALLASNADVIGLQELNPATAQLIARELRGRYPYQFLHPDADRGMGVLSRLPARDACLRIGGTWLGTPIVVDVTVGRAHTLVADVHAVSTIFRSSWIETEVRQRAEAARALVAFARQKSSTPLIVTTDFNSTDQNDPYGIVTSTLADSWREAGWVRVDDHIGEEQIVIARISVVIA